MRVGGDESDAVRPRAVRSPKLPSQPAPSSAEETWMPRTWRCPSALTPVATMASAATNVYEPASSGRVRNASTWASRSAAITETWDFESRVIPRVSTSFSIRRVETPRR